MKSFAITRSFGLIAATALAPETGTSLGLQTSFGLDHKAPRGEWNSFAIGHKDQNLIAAPAGTSFDTSLGFGKLSL